MELFSGLEQLHQRMLQEDVPPIDFGDVLQECLVPVAGVRPTADLIIKATHMLPAISEGAVIWWEANHLFGMQPTCVMAVDALAAWGLDSGEHYVQATAASIFAQAQDILLTQSVADFVDWAKCGSDPVIENPPRMFYHLQDIFVKDNWVGFDQ